MKKMTLLVLTMSAWAGVASALSVNTKDAETHTNDATIALSGATAFGSKTSTVIEATLVFGELPSATPAWSNSDLLAITCDTDGTLLISDSTAWKKTANTMKIAAGATVNVTAVATPNGDKTNFNVTLTSGTTTDTVTVTAPATKATPEQILAEGVGTMSDLLVAQAPLAIVNAPDAGAQDPATVTKYAAWAVDTGKGSASAMTGATAAEKQNAFAMNVGVKTPTIEITDIDVANKRIKLHASAGEADVDLKKINGVLTIVYASTLTGTATQKEIKVSTDLGTDSYVTLPEDAVFVKARVTVTLPAAPAKLQPAAE